MSLYLKDSIDGTRKVLDPKNTINLQDPKKKKIALTYPNNVLSEIETRKNTLIKLL